MKRASLSDIAKRCNVTAPTVSKVLNGKTKGFSVKPEIREKILEVAEELKYRPHQIARTLKMRRTKLIGMVGRGTIWASKRGIYQLTMQGISQGLKECGFDLLVSFHELEGGQLKVPKWDVEGIIILDTLSSDNIREIDQSDLPYVAINGVAGPKGFSVIADDGKGMEKAIDHLRDMGHKSIAYLGPINDLTHYSSERRLKSFHARIESLGFRGIAADFNCKEPEARKLLEELTKEKFTALITYDHYMANCLYTTAVNMGVGESLSYLCFNDISALEPSYQFTDDFFTCVRVPAYEMGYEGVKALTGAIEKPGQSTPATITLAEEIVKRKSIKRI